MLIGIPAILSPELLATLRMMGHGDEIAIVDGNYPAAAHARRLVRADGHGLVPVIDAILHLLPVDDFVEQALFRMMVRNDPDILEPVQREIIAACARHAPKMPVVPLTGQGFYDRTKNAFAVVATGEPRHYANLIIRKGVIYPEKGGRT